MWIRIALEARGWEISDLAYGMPGDHVENYLSIELILAAEQAGEHGHGPVYVDKMTARRIACAFGEAPDLWIDRFEPWERFVKQHTRTESKK